MEVRKIVTKKPKRVPKCVEYLPSGRCFRTEDFPTPKQVAAKFYNLRMTKRTLSALIRKAHKAGLTELSDAYQEIKEEA